MVKKIVFVLMMVFSVAMISGIATAKADTVSGYSYTSCNPWVMCPAQGLTPAYTVSYQLYGSAYYGVPCTWTVIPGRYVECNGYNAAGVWVKYWHWCY